MRERGSPPPRLGGVARSLAPTTPACDSTSTAPRCCRIDAAVYIYKSGRKDRRRDEVCDGDSDGAVAGRDVVFGSGSGDGDYFFFGLVVKIGNECILGCKRIGEVDLCSLYRILIAELAYIN